jgi:hypothetical protein
MEISEIVNNKDRTLFLISPSELSEFAENVASRILSANSKPLPQVKEEKPFSQSEAIQFLGKSRQTLVVWRKKGVIKAYRLGGRIYYKPSELVAALEKLG